MVIDVKLLLKTPRVSAANLYGKWGNDPSYVGEYKPQIKRCILCEAVQKCPFLLTAGSRFERRGVPSPTHARSPPSRASAARANVPGCPGGEHNCTPGKTRLRKFAQLPGADGVTLPERGQHVREKSPPPPHSRNKPITILDGLSLCLFL